MTALLTTLWGVNRGLPGSPPESTETVLLDFEAAVGHLRDLIDEEESGSDGTHGTEFENINHAVDDLGSNILEAWWEVPGSTSVWTLYRIAEPDEATKRAAALCESLGDSVVSDVVDDWDGDVTFSCGLRTYLVLTEDEADAMAEERISDMFDEWVDECPAPWCYFLHVQSVRELYTQEHEAGDTWALLGDYEQCRGYVVVRQ